MIRFVEQIWTGSNFHINLMRFKPIKLKKLLTYETQLPKFIMPEAATQRGWLFSCKFAAYFQNAFSWEHFLVAASVMPL